MNDQVIAILTWVILGLIVGLLARFIMPGRQRGGIILLNMFRLFRVHYFIMYIGENFMSD